LDGRCNGVIFLYEDVSGAFPDLHLIIHSYAHTTRSLPCGVPCLIYFLLRYRSSIHWTQPQAWEPSSVPIDILMDRAPSSSFLSPLRNLCIACLHAVEISYKLVRHCHFILYSLRFIFHIDIVSFQCISTTAGMGHYLICYLISISDI